MYPKTVDENKEYRLTLRMLWLRKDEVGKQARSLAYSLASEDVLYFFNTFLWAEDPFAVQGLRHGIARDRIRPIVTYPFQDEHILAIEEAINVGEDDITDKSRDMLATYIVLGIFLHGWLFKSRKFMITSWKEKEIDGKEDTSTHFGKLRMNLSMQPRWLLPKDFNMKKHCTDMSIINPETRATIIGSAASANLASGRREDAILFDELSKWEEHAQSAWTSASDATRCKLGLWTPRGIGNHAANLMRGSEVKRKHHLFWHLHPEKVYTSPEHLEKVKSGEIRDKVRGYVVELGRDQSGAKEGCYLDQNGRLRSEWYDKECEGRTKEDISENLDCDYLSTGQPVFDTLICERRKYESMPPKRVGELHWKVRPIFDINGQLTNEEETQVEFIDNYNGNVFVWEEPIKGWEDGYLVSADCAEGLEQGDFNSAPVRRRFPKREEYATFKPTTVAEIHGKQKTFEYAEDLVKLAIWYGRAWLAIEKNNQGLAVINEAFRFYRKLYHDDVMISGYAEKKDRIGFTTSAYTKEVIINGLSKSISLERFSDPREGFWEECLTFVNNDGKKEAMGKSQGMKCYDDRVMSGAIIDWIDTQLSPAWKKIEIPEGQRWLNQRKKKQSQESLVGWVV